jgi:hypothetical protein
VAADLAVAFAGEDQQEGVRVGVVEGEELRRKRKSRGGDRQRPIAVAVKAGERLMSSMADGGVACVVARARRGIRSRPLEVWKSLPGNGLEGLGIPPSCASKRSRRDFQGNWARVFSI